MSTNETSIDRKQTEHELEKLQTERDRAAWNVDARERELHVAIDKVRSHEFQLSAARREFENVTERVRAAEERLELLDLQDEVTKLRAENARLKRDHGGGARTR